MNRRTIFFQGAIRFTGMLCMICGLQASAADPPDATPPNSTPVDPRSVDRQASTPAATAGKPALRLEELLPLVQQLGDDSYTVREEASRQLTDLGLLAKDALVVGMEDRDVEIRTRCRRLWVVVQSVDFENRMKAFIEDTEGKKEHHLPNWERFRQVVGDDRPARELFIEMQRAESNLLEAAAEAPKAAGEIFSVACRDFQQLLFGQNRFQQSQISLGSVAALVFVGSDPKVPISDQSLMMIYNFVNQPSFQQALNGGPKMPQIRKLLGQWVGRRTGPNTAYQNLMLAMQYDLKEGLNPALEMVASKDLHASQKAYAIVAVGKLGTKEHLPLLEKLFADTTTCAAYQINDQRIVTETRDVALAVVVHLTGQTLKDYGFDRVQSNPQMLFYPYTLGFQDTTRRDTAFKKWTDWQAAQKKK